MQFLAWNSVKLVQLGNLVIYWWFDFLGFYWILLKLGLSSSFRFLGSLLLLNVTVMEATIDGAQHHYFLLFTVSVWHLFLICLSFIAWVDCWLQLWFPNFGSVLVLLLPLLCCSTSFQLHPACSISLLILLSANLMTLVSKCLFVANLLISLLNL